ncbi:MAG: hypothetical protein Q7J80_04790, partial [Anaerolineales bacterium]|nr:hypothetical protein [Anaerolineales bacterium]
PLLDRIDTACRIEVPRVDYEKLSGNKVSKTDEASELDAGGHESTAIIRARLCTAQCHRTRSVKLARTIADLAGSEEIQSTHLAEALHLRSSEDHDVMNVFLENDIRFIN